MTTYLNPSNRVRRFEILWGQWTFTALLSDYDCIGFITLHSYFPSKASFLFYSKEFRKYLKYMWSLPEAGRGTRTARQDPESFNDSHVSSHTTFH
jgi:hypothetical protein